MSDPSDIKLIAGSAEFRQLLARMVREEAQKLSNYKDRRNMVADHRTGRADWFHAVSDDGVGAGSRTSPTTGTATIYDPNPGSGLVERTGETIDIVNYGDAVGSGEHFIAVNFGAEWVPLLGGGSTNAVIGHGVIVDTMCDEYYVIVEADAQTTWVNGCQVLPGQTYEGDIHIYDPCPDDSGKLAGYTETQLLGAVVQFYRACNPYSGESKYFIIDLCITAQCDDV